MNNKLLHIVLFFAAVLCLASCGGKKNQKEALLNDIEQYHIDTVDVSKKEQIGTSELDEVLRHYPEMYHASEKCVSACRLWMKKEGEMISTTFVGKDKKRVQKAAKCQSALSDHLKSYGIEAIMQYALLGQDDVEAAPLTDDVLTSDTYMKLFSYVEDGLQETDRHAATNAIRSSIGHARKTWNDYIAQLKETAQTIPEDCRPRYIKAVNTMVTQHYIDLLNRYYQYVTGASKPWMLNYDATHEQISAFEYMGREGCEWMTE